MRATIKVRPMQALDVAGACRILNGIIATGGTTALGVEVNEAEFAAMYLGGADLIASHVALDPTGNVAGFQWIGVNPNLPSDCADIATFTRRDPPLRGAGRALFEVTKDVAKSRGYARINAPIRADNVPGLGFYTKMGFVDHGVARAVPLKDGTPVDRLARRYSLES